MKFFEKTEKVAEISSEWLEKLECATVRARIGAVVRCHPIFKDAEFLSEVKSFVTELLSHILHILFAVMW